MSFRKWLYFLVTTPSKWSERIRLGMLKRDMGHIGERVTFKDLSSMTLEGRKHLYVEDECVFGKGLVLTAWGSHGQQRFTPKISIGKGCNFGEYNHISAIREIRIGNHVLTGRWVTITDNSHGKTDFSELETAPMERPLFSKGPVIIEDNVWLGDKATILPGVHIGRGSVVGANCVVAKDVPPFSVVVGNPGRIIKILNDNVIRI